MTHYVVIYALMVSWYPRRRFGDPIGDIMMDLDPWRSPCMVKVKMMWLDGTMNLEDDANHVEEAHLEDDDNLVDDAKDLGDGVEALVDDGEALDGLEKH